MVLIPRGEFTLGSPATERGRSSDEGPQTVVMISQDYYVGTTPITQEQWLAVMGEWPGAESTAQSPEYGEGPKYPAYYISWNDAQAFLESLNRHIEESGQGPLVLRLPSEAEWEKAARAGTTTRFFFGDSLECNDLHETCASESAQEDRSSFMWFSGNNGVHGETDFGAKPVGQINPNSWGLYDMHGNVNEWCQDWYSVSFPGGKVTDYAGPESGTHRVVRGGAWNSIAASNRSASRMRFAPTSRSSSVGLRVFADRPMEQQRFQRGPETVTQPQPPPESTSITARATDHSWSVDHLTAFHYLILLFEEYQRSEEIIRFIESQGPDARYSVVDPTNGREYNINLARDRIRAEGLIETIVGRNQEARSRIKNDIERRCNNIGIEPSEIMTQYRSAWRSVNGDASLELFYMFRPWVSRAIYSPGRIRLIEDGSTLVIEERSRTTPEEGGWIRRDAEIRTRVRPDFVEVRTRDRMTFEVTVVNLSDMPIRSIRGHAHFLSSDGTLLHDEYFSIRRAISDPIEPSEPFDLRFTLSGSYRSLRHLDQRDYSVIILPTEVGFLEERTSPLGNFATEWTRNSSRRIAVPHGGKLYDFRE